MLVPKPTWYLYQMKSRVLDHVVHTCLCPLAHHDLLLLLDHVSQLGENPAEFDDRRFDILHRISSTLQILISLVVRPGKQATCFKIMFFYPRGYFQVEFLGHVVNLMPSCFPSPEELLRFHGQSDLAVVFALGRVIVFHRRLKDRTRVEALKIIVTRIKTFVTRCDQFFHT